MNYYSSDESENEMDLVPVLREERNRDKQIIDNNNVSLNVEDISISACDDDVFEADVPAQVLEYRRSSFLEQAWEEASAPVKAMIASREQALKESVQMFTKEHLVDQEALQKWDPTCIYGGLGVTVSNKKCSAVPVIRLADFLANINSHLILIQKEVIYFRELVAQSHEAGEATELGFDDANNVSHLRAMLCSVDGACVSLSRHLSEFSSVLGGRRFVDYPVFSPLLLALSLGSLSFVIWKYCRGRLISH